MKGVYAKIFEARHNQTMLHPRVYNERIYIQCRQWSNVLRKQHQLYHKPCLLSRCSKMGDRVAFFYGNVRHIVVSRDTMLTFSRDTRTSRSCPIQSRHEASVITRAEGLIFANSNTYERLVGPRNPISRNLRNDESTQ